MKRIMDGVTYDTETATRICGFDNVLYSGGWWNLYQNRHGAFFCVTCDHDGETITFEPVEDEEAQKLTEKYANHLVEKFFGPFPEYGSAEKRLTLRIPAGLFRRIEAEAQANSLNINRYIMRSLEKILSSQGNHPSTT